MRKLDERKRNLVIVVVVFLCAGLFIDQAALGPLRNKRRAKIQALGALKNKIDRVEGLLKGYSRMGEGIIALKNKSEDLQRRIPSTGGSAFILKELSGQALRFGIRVVSITPLEPVPFGNVGGAICKKFPIEIKAEGRFRNLGEYIEALKKDVSALLTVEELILQRDAAIAPNIRARLVVAQYVLRDE